MAETTTKRATLADLIAAVQAADLSAIQRRDQVSAIRAVAKVLGASSPAEVELNIKLLRRRLDEVSPEASGMNRARWKNVRSLFSRALELKTPVMRSSQRVAIAPAWVALGEKLSASGRLRLGALFRFLSEKGVGPEHVTAADLEAFREAIVENRLRSTPEKTWDGVVWVWNKSADNVPGWPPVKISREDRRTVYVRSWSDFPESLKADVDAYLRRLSGDEIHEDGPIRALRSSTLKNREYQARAAASALVAHGTRPERIRSLRDIARLGPIKVVLEHVLSRGEKSHEAGAFNMANFLKAVAQHWVKVDEDELAKIRRITSRLSKKQKGLTEKNRRRLMPFNDPEVVRRFLSLPARLCEEVRADGRRTVVNAVTMQLAVAISILQAVPIRIRNLAALDLEEHLVERGGRVFLLIAAHEVKNDRDYQMELPGEVADLIAAYCLGYRDMLITAPTTALFPGENGAPKLPNTLGRQISERAKRYLGFPVNPHLFRHIAAKIYLDRRPGEYGLVSRLLNHKSVATTMAAYTGAETISAGRHYQTVLADLRGPITGGRFKKGAPR